MISAKIPNPDKTASKATRVDGLADYITAPENTQSIEKCIASGAENFMTRTHEGQKAEMIALAQEAVRSKDPVDHFVLSWKENEKPTPEQAKEAVEIFVKQCGLTGHQHIWGLHDDTQNMHVHIAINRVHPVTYKVIEINKGFDREAQQQAVALIEHKQGWSREAHARYDIVDGKPVLSAHGQLAKQRGKAPSKREVDMEVRTGEKSAKRHTIEDAAPIIKAAKSWQELHAGLAKIGMRYEREGSGAKIYVGDVGIKASSADRTASINQLQKRLGIFQPLNQEQPHVHFTHTPQPYPNQARTLSGNGMRRLSQCRMASTSGNEKAPRVLHIDARTGRREVERMRRATGRDTGRSEPLKQNQAGWNEYTKGRQADKAARAARNTSLRDKHAEERATLATRQKAHRASVFSGDWKGKGDVLNTMRSVIAAQQAVEKLNLQEQHKAERVGLQQAPYPSYEQFLRDKGAPELAERWRYKDSPDKQPCVITGKTTQQIPPRDIRDFEHRIVGREVSYRLRGAGGFGPEAFIDRGKNIAVLDHKSPAAVTAALQLGAQKFGNRITVTGNDEYKRLCVQLAVKHGIQIVNPELQQLIAAEKQGIEQQRAADRQAEEQKRINARMQTKENTGKEAQTQAKTVEQTQTTAKAPSLSKPSTQPTGLEAQPTALDLDRVLNAYLTPVKGEHAQFAADLTTRANAKDAEQQPSHVTVDMLNGQPLSIEQMKALDKELDRLGTIAKGAALALRDNQPRPPEELTPAQIDAQGIQLAKLAINAEAAQKWPNIAQAFPDNQYQGDHWQHAATVSQQQLADHLKTQRPLLRNAEWDKTKQHLETEAANWNGGIEWRTKRLQDLKPAKVAEALKAHGKAQQEATAKRAAAFKAAAIKLHQVEQKIEKTGKALFSQPEPLQREFQQVLEREHKQELERVQALGLQRGGMSR